MSQYSLEALLEIMAKLRSPEGCPWDIKQTHKSLVKDLIEESYEVIDAINQEDPKLLADELGDLLLQIVFHTQIAKENNQFSMNEVIEAICTKMIRRHPHVFSDTKVSDVNDVLTNWEAIKQQEKLNSDRTSILDGIPQQLPALMRAEKIQSKVQKVGFDWDNIQGPLNKLNEEVQEFQETVANNDYQGMTEELGDLLFSIVNIARHLDLNPELALTNTNENFIKRFQHMEEQAKAINRKLEDMSFAEMDQLWENAKKTPSS